MPLPCSCGMAVMPVAVQPTRATDERCGPATCCLVRAWHAEHVLTEEGEHEVVRDGRDAVEARLAELSLDVVLLRKAEAAVGVEARVRRRPRRLRGEQLRHVRLRAARL